MKKRFKMSRRASKRLFRRTAMRTKAINVNSNVGRGGIRL